MPEIDSYTDKDPQDGDEFVVGRGTDTRNILWDNLKEQLGVNIYGPGARDEVTWSSKFDTSAEIIQLSDAGIEPGSTVSAWVQGKSASGTQTFRAKLRSRDSGGTATDFGSNSVDVDTTWTVNTFPGQIPSDSVSIQVQFANDTESDDMSRRRLMVVPGDIPIPFLQVLRDGIVGAQQLNGSGTDVELPNTSLFGVGKTASYHIHSAGDVAADGTVRDLSDRRVKEAIEPITDPLKRIQDLQGHTYDRTDLGRHSAGLVAQEVEEVFPVAVDESSDLKTLDQGALLGLAYSAISALREENEQLRERLDKIEAQI